MELQLGDDPAVTTSTAERLVDEHPGKVPVQGFLHQAPSRGGSALVLTHGASGNCNTPLLIALAEALSSSGITVLRCDLPFRQARPHGPPSPGSAKQDQEGLRRAVTVLKEKAAGPVFLGGQSYGGRQASILTASEPSLASGLLLLSYPLHPPGRSEQLRTGHFPSISVPTLFVSGTKDPFGTVEELQRAISLIERRLN